MADRGYVTAYVENRRADTYLQHKAALDFAAAVALFRGAGAVINSLRSFSLHCD
jgi:fructose-1,6-bisphosphatase/inositol monophosphatase family enzyme